jgi:glucose-1-phosphate adenylyltransferase
MTPFVGVNEIRWFHGTGDAIAKNINLIDLPDLDDVLVLSGEHVYRMDYRRLIEHHRTTGADVTLAGVVIPPEQQHPRFGNIVAQGGGRVEAFVEKPEHPISSIVSMGIYCFKRKVLLDLLARYKSRGVKGEFSLASDVLQPHVASMNAQAFIFYQPWYYLADLREYYDFHMQLAEGKINLFDPTWDIITNFSDRNLSSRTPAFFSPRSEVSSSIICSGGHIEGQVVRSVLSPGVSVGPGSIVRNCVIFHDVQIGAGCLVENAIIDKDVVVEDQARIGVPEEEAAGRNELPAITIVPKTYRVSQGEVISPGAQIEAPVLI